MSADKVPDPARSTSEPPRAASEPLRAASEPARAEPEPLRAADLRFSMPRITRSAAFVALWMAIGVVFRVVRAKWHVHVLDENAYLVVGVPLTIGWQLLVRKRPLLELWVDRWANQAGGPRRIAVGVFAAALAGILPIYSLAKGWPQIRREPQMLAWYLCALVGAMGVGYAASKLQLQRDLRSLFGCLGTAGVVGSGLMVFFTLLRAFMLHQAMPHALHALRVGAESFALYLPVCFTLEEVTFRGLVDADVRDGRFIEGLAMATFSSLLWGLWHVPIAPVTKPVEFASVTVAYAIIHVMIGIPLALWYRRSGNLLVPALTHAFIDGVRNGLQSAT